VRVGHFFSQGPRKHFSLVRASDQKVATRFASKSGTDYGYEYIALGAEKRERVMEPFLITITPPSGSPGEKNALDEATAHGGEEFIHVLEGEIEVQLEDQSYLLAPGDSIYYDASVQHRVLHRGDRPSKVLAVFHFPRAQD
jgi:mannose-6-phosphate isomerase-like protein (cupin superfamily)